VQNIPRRQDITFEFNYDFLQNIHIGRNLMFERVLCHVHQRTVWPSTQSSVSDRSVYYTYIVPVGAWYLGTWAEALHTNSASRGVSVGEGSGSTLPAGYLIVKMLGFHPRWQTVAPAADGGWWNIVL
jgi:hypothetical protein